MNPTESEGRLKLLATKDFESWSELYKVVDFLNKNLKDYGIMFGLSKNNEQEMMTITIYEI